MRKRSTFLAVAVTAAATLALTTRAARLENASVVEKDGSSLASAARAAGAGTGTRWVAWDVPTSDPESTMCCFESVEKGRKASWKGGVCSLASQSNFISNHGDDGSSTLAKRETVAVFVRFEDGQPAGVRVFSQDCRVNAAGASVTRLTGVKAEDSVSYLASLIDSLLARAPDGGKKRHRHGAEEAVAAIAVHEASNAMRTLESIVENDDRDDDLRGQAAFWLGMKGGAAGREYLRHAIDADPSSRFRDQAIAGIAQDEDRAAVDLLLRLAHDHPSTHVRRQAVFWLGQRAGNEVIGELREAAADPNDEVKEMAVFAISQLPRNESVPELIRLAKTHSSRAVREKAIFWLGQTGDPLALDFIQDVLTR